MRTMMLTLILSSILVNAVGQKAPDELPEGKYTKMTIRKRLSVKVDGISYYQGNDTTGKYYATLNFGRNTFDLEIRETNTNKIVWALYRLSKRTDFRLDKNASTSYDPIYRMEETNGNRVSKYEVHVIEGLNLSFIVGYRTIDKTTGKVISAVVGTGEL
jgi:hypothetical protein